jgi:hypothetical protein
MSDILPARPTRTSTIVPECCIALRAWNALNHVAMNCKFFQNIFESTRVVVRRVHI